MPRIDEVWDWSAVGRLARSGNTDEREEEPVAPTRPKVSRAWTGVPLSAPGLDRCFEALCGLTQVDRYNDGGRALLHDRCKSATLLARRLVEAYDLDPTDPRSFELAADRACEEGLPGAEPAVPPLAADAPAVVLLVHLAWRLHCEQLSSLCRQSGVRVDGLTQVDSPRTARRNLEAKRLQLDALLARYDDPERAPKWLHPSWPLLAWARLRCLRAQVAAGLELLARIEARGLTARKRPDGRAKRFRA